MSNNNLFRIAGWCALLAALVMGAFFVALSMAPTSGIGEVFAVVGVLVLTLVFYALSVVHRAESALLSLAGLVLWLPAGVLDVASLLNPTNTVLYAVDSLLFSLPFLIFGYLGYRNVKMPRWLAWMALLCGVCWAIVGITSFNASTVEIGMVAGLGGFVFMLAWLIGLWRVFLSGKLAST